MEEIEFNDINNYYGFIYITINKLDNKKYIGQRKFYEGWEKYLGSGVLLTRSIEKYGRHNFERKIIDLAETQEELDNKERYWVDFYSACESKDFYNLAKGGKGSTTFSMSRERYLKWKDHPNRKIGRKHRPTRVYCHQTKETFDDINDASKKYNIETKYIRRSCRRHNYISGYYNGIGLTWETLYRTRSVQTSNGKMVICITNGVVFNSISEASRKYNLKRPNITKCCNGEVSMCGRDNNGNKLVWMYYEDYVFICNLEFLK